MPQLSEHFHSREFVCGCGSLHGGPTRGLLNALEALRALKGRPLAIVSGRRCPEFNRRVGGIATSQHLYGRAVDIPGGYANVAECWGAGFIGVGTRGGRVVHVDLTPGRRSFQFID